MEIGNKENLDIIFTIKVIVANFSRSLLVQKGSMITENLPYKIEPWRFLPKTHRKVHVLRPFNTKPVCQEILNIVYKIEIPCL